MTLFTLVLRSLRFHARSHLGVLLGATVGSAALVGALAVGDSVRGSLRQMALLRLGNVDLALHGGDRFFRDQLANDLEAGSSAQCAPLLQVSGTISTAEGDARANHVQVFGIDQRLSRLQPSAPQFKSNSLDEVILNSALARQLERTQGRAIKRGDTVLLRLQKPSALSREAPISPQQDYSLALRLKVGGIAADDQFGRFSLNAGQLPPLNAFVPLALLQQRLELTNAANLLLVRGADAEEMQKRLRGRWTLADAELEERPISNGREVRSRRVFIDPPIAQAFYERKRETRGILTYFVNELRDGSKSTPYSMVTGAGPPLVPPDMEDDEILVSQWLADDLQTKPGDRLQLTYYVMGSAQRLEQRTNFFRLRGGFPLALPYADRTLMPDFPGLAKAESTENWDAGFPIQMSKIRPKDEQYWKEFRGSPKALVTLAAAQSMWSNRFGNLTALRFPAGNEIPGSPASLEATLGAVNPGSIGLLFQPVRAQALAASAGSQDFGQLFLGFSFFLILAALILMGLLFQFHLEQRASEIGTLLALGFRPKQVRRIFLFEGAVLALAGGAAGVVLGLGYARLMLLGLATIWSKAIGSSALSFHLKRHTIVIGAFASFMVALITIALVLRKQGRRPARELLAERAGSETVQGSAKSGKTRWVAVGCSFVACALVLVTILRGDTANAGVFFGAGVLLLIAGLSWAAVFLSRLANTKAVHHLTLAGMGLRSATRQRRRSLATMALLACGSFMIVAVGANRLDANRDAFQRSSGTGGFAFIGESSLPVIHDLNRSEGRDFYALKADALRDVSVVPMRVREGDDASCLNLNRAQNPRLLGVKPNLLQDRNAFSFASVAKGEDEKRRWSLLDEKLPDGSIPAIGDYNSILWALGKKLGDTLDYVDERGRPFKIKLVGAVANSILQGNLLMSEQNFTSRFPSISGYRMFLVDAPSNTVTQTAALLTRGLQDAGLELTPAAERLNYAFNAVQNTYLNTFQVLGGLGLLIGSAGLAVVVLRNVLERRGELALLQAVGFRRRSLRWLVLSEHAGLLTMGLIIGLVAAVLAIAPSFSTATPQLPVLSLAVTIGGVFISGLIWTWLAVSATVRGRLLDALRDE